MHPHGFLLTSAAIDGGTTNASPVGRVFVDGGTDAEHMEIRQRLHQSAGSVNFRLFDDDDELYYEGKFLTLDPDPGPGLGQEAFAPLEWAQGYAGCTRIDYQDRATGAWATL